MSPARTHRVTRSRALRTIGALCWSALLLLHLWLLFAADGSGERSLGAQAGLVLASAFFALLLLRPRFLRLSSPRRAILVTALLAGFMHQDVRAAVWEGAASPRAIEVSTAATALAAAMAIVITRRLPARMLLVPLLAPHAVRATPVRVLPEVPKSRRLSLLPRPPPIVLRSTL